MTTTHFHQSIQLIVLTLLWSQLAHARTDCSQVTQIPQTECEALLDLYQRTNGHAWKKKWDWGYTNEPCDWHSRKNSVFAVAGVTCKSGHVTVLHLNNNRLNGPIPQSISHLTQLRYLFLAKNRLTGPIHDSLSNLSQLTKLWLNDNELSGTIPDFLGKLDQLKELLLNGNQFEGTISEVINQLNQLDFLNLAQNQFSGLFPKSLTSLSKLIIDDKHLSNSICVIVTQIPQAECRSLYEFYRQTNGPVWKNNAGWNNTKTPCDWQGITCHDGHVTRLELSDNQVSGSIPKSMGYSLSKLTNLKLDNNQLSGTIPPSFGHLTQLTTLELNHNQLSGTIPVQIGYLSQLQRLVLSNNQLSGLIPMSIGKLSRLELLELSKNQLSGYIPTSLKHLKRLSSLNLSGNQNLTGSICPAVTQIPQAECEVLVHLYHSTNGDHWKNNKGWNSTNTPCDWKGISCNDGHVTRLELDYNQLSGPIPKSIGNLSQLKSLSLDSNKISGPIPESIGYLSQLQRLVLSNNQLSGPIPKSIGNLSQLKNLYLSDNQLSCDEIPTSLKNSSTTVRCW
jgi:Leucine-rich repeat (LRR) protein